MEKIDQMCQKKPTTHLFYSLLQPRIVY